MISSGQKWISLWVVLTFMWFLHVSAMPLAAECGAAHVGQADSDQEPGFFETSSQKPAPAGGKSVLPYILIGAGVAVVAAILFLVVFKAKYDIAGNWTGIENYYGNSYFRWYKFSGDKKSGVVETIDPATFSVISTAPYDGNGKRITWSIYFSSFSGAFDSPTAIKGDIFLQGGKIGTFALTKSSLDLAAPLLPQECDIIGTWVFEFNRRGGMENMAIEFSGNRTNGEFMAKESAWMKGTYTVVNTDVTMLTTDKPDVHFSGRFTAKNIMAGSWLYMTEAWTWTARRQK